MPDPAPKLPLAFACLAAALLAASQIAGASRFSWSPGGELSLALQHGAVIGTFVAMHAFADRRSAARVAFAGLLAYLAFALLDVLSLSVFSVRVDAVARVLSLGNDPFGVLRQANVSIPLLDVAAALVAASLVFLVVLYRRLPRIRASRAAAAAAILLPALLSALFFAEQYESRDSDTYLRRSAALPGYIRVFTPASDTLAVALPAVVSDAQFDAAVTAVRTARNPKNVLFIVLESVRSDVIDPLLTPAMDRLAQRSIVFTHAYTEAPSTPRAWNALLLDRPAWTAYNDSLDVEAKQVPGAFPMRALKQAGYQLWVSMPTDLGWLGFTQRILGTGLVDRNFSSYTGSNDNQHIADARAADEVVQWIADAGTRPFFALIQLDGSHYTYYFDESRAVVRPYSTAANPYLVTSQAEMDLVFNRYRNSVHEVDFHIGRMLDALEKSGLTASTAVVIASDHGQSFRLGAVAHMPVNEATKRIPVMLALPGINPREDDAYVSLADVFPTLFDYLGIEGVDDSVWIGRSQLARDEPHASALTFRVDMREAQLSLPLVSVVFDVDRTRDAGVVTLTFTPTGVLDRNERPVEGWRNLLASIPWKDEVQVHLARRPGT